MVRARRAFLLPVAVAYGLQLSAEPADLTVVLVALGSQSIRYFPLDPQKDAGPDLLGGNNVIPPASGTRQQMEILAVMLACL